MGRLLVLRRASWSLPKDEQVFDSTLFCFIEYWRIRVKTKVFALVLASLKYDQFLTQQELDKWNSPLWGELYLGIFLSKHIDVS